ncbi:laminin B domain-containing protein [Flavilitoribacter nigricans]|uniref:Laminin IV type A domain-containing protein n=1 Tax=Flavilitoribacter nigricans (strain ATCC 23147 / DSM 23189 / NBRC 102662 / NCIMB 1420 / SS-2) TaxID=1122177 RepID=A0A2D0N479_FLAN2|nr:laminin B domain-containing protein [Flavilitoribacter nigricans]PHN03247.1 hypothetical protein CRP01_28035 [Flavilitoribacter nigricans DSM 23189 = NBRC 102662]
MKSILYLLLCLFFGYLASVEAQVSSSFADHSDRWTIIPAQTQVQYQSGGPTNGYIFGSDFLLPDQAINWFFSAPAKYAGNLTAYYQGVLAFRLKLLRPGDGPLPAHYDVVIVGGKGEALVYKLPNSPGTQWTPYRIGLRPDDPNWRVVPQNTLAVNSTAAPVYQANWPKPNARQFYGILTNVRSLHIRGEHVTGDDGCALDEVYLGKPNF